MPSYVTPKKNTEFVFYIQLEANAGGSYVSNPTIATGDFIVSTDGGATANLGTLPTVTPASGKGVKVTVSASEMNGDNIRIEWNDAAGSEWLPGYALIQTTASQIDDLATSAEITALNDPTAAAIADAVWDEPIAGHLTAGTAGLSEALGSAAIVDTTVTGTPTSTTIELTAGSAIDDFYNDQLVYILSGTGIGQVRVVSDYTGATKTITVDEAFVTTPAAADRVAVLVAHVHAVSQIQAGLATEAKQDTIDAVVDAIKAKTDSLTFTQAGEVDANIQSVNDTAVTGDGGEGTEWGPV